MAAKDDKVRGSFPISAKQYDTARDLDFIRQIIKQPNDTSKTKHIQ